MTNYYIIENNIITQSANFKFDKNCLETEEEIVRKDDGTLLLKSDYDIYIQSDLYKNKVKSEKKKIITAQYKDKFNELDGVYATKFARGLSTTTEVNAKRANLQAEFSAKLQEVDNG